MHEYNQIKSIISGIPAADGDGVQLTRIIGSHQLPELDPFLLLDHFGSDQPDDYIGGFPPHPHRGFETVTYMLQGKMRHQDSVGNNGVIEDGGVQWMTAGSGIIHSEMPEQTEGLLSGFQLWVNLPASDKMIQPQYQEYAATEIPVEVTDQGARLKVIAGKTLTGTKGIIKNPYTQPNYWDVSLPAGIQLFEHIKSGHNAFVYVYEGRISIADQTIKHGELATLSAGEKLKVAGIENARFIVISGQPLNEPVERAGPFVMNTREQLQQAFNDYQSGRFAQGGI